MIKPTKLLLNVLFCLAVSCNSSSPSPKIDPQIIAEIEKTVAIANSQCPAYYGIGNDAILESLTYENNVVTYNYHVDRIYNGAESSKDRVKNSLLYMLKGETEVSTDSKNFITNIIKADCKLVYKYKTSSGDSIQIEILNEDLKKVFR